MHAGTLDEISVLQDVSLPSIDPSGKPSSGDVYFLPDGEDRPLLIVMPGAFGEKAWYSGIANELVSAGEGVVLVTQQNSTIPLPEYASPSPHVCTIEQLAHGRPILRAAHGGPILVRSSHLLKYTQTAA
jgi:hypothetical protein